MPAPGTEPLPGDFTDLMMELVESEIVRYRKLGSDTGLAIEAAARSVEAGMTENQAAALLDELRAQFGCL